MEEEILTTLKETNEHLQRLTVLTLIGVAAWILRSVFAIINHGTAIIKRNWREKAQSLFEDGNHEKLLKKSKELIAALPNSPEGYFWKARAERELGLENDLKNTIDRLLELAPDWKEEWMDQVLKPADKPETRNGEQGVATHVP